MDPNIYITSMEFASKKSGEAEMAGIRLNYSDGSTYLYENN